MNNEKKDPTTQEIELLREMLAWIVECRIKHESFLVRAMDMGMQATVCHPLRKIDLALNHAEDNVIWKLAKR